MPSSSRVWRVSSQQRSHHHGWPMPSFLLLLLLRMLVLILMMLPFLSTKNVVSMVRAHSGSSGSPWLPSRRRRRRHHQCQQQFFLRPCRKNNPWKSTSSLFVRAGDISQTDSTILLPLSLSSSPFSDNAKKEEEEVGGGGGGSVVGKHHPSLSSSYARNNNILQADDASAIMEGNPATLGKNNNNNNQEEEEEAHVGIAKKLKNRNATNLSRKLTHAGFGIFFACLNQYVPKTKFVPSMTLLTASTLLMELLRYRRGFHWMNVTLHFVLGGALRKHEMEGKFTGSFYYFAGVTACAYLFPKTAGTLGICQLALADPSASYFGRRTRHIYWSRIENGLGGLGRNKGILGFLGGALFCFPFNYRVFKIAKWGVTTKGIVPGGEWAVVSASLLLGLAGAFADLAVPTPALTMPKKVLGVPVPPFHLDDNFVVPIFSGWACTKIFALLGWDDGLELAEHIVF